MTRFDHGAALVATAYQERPRNLLKLMRLGRLPATVIGRLSDSVTQRFGVSDLSPSTLAYWQEWCGIYGFPSQRVGSPDLQAAEFLRSWHAPCQFIGRSALPKSEWRTKACLVIDAKDRVVPRIPAEDWARYFPNSQLHYLRRGMHGLIDDVALEPCRGR